MTSAITSLLFSVLVGTSGTDTTVAVRPGTRLQLECFAGSIEVGTWDRPAVRVEADHSRRVHIDIDNDKDGSLSISASSHLGVPIGVDYKLTVPPWMPLELSGMATDISVEGVKASIKANSIRGDVTVLGGGTQVSAESVEGDVKVRGARGRVEASSINQDVEVTDCSCEITAEAVNGNVFIGPGDSKSVEATSVNGSLLYAGALRSGGSYSFSTHGGDIVVGLPEHPDVAVSVATFGGNFSSYIPISLANTKRGKRFSFQLGQGSAQLEMESFQGAIRLEKAGEAMKARLERYRQMAPQPMKVMRLRTPRAAEAPEAPETPQPPKDPKDPKDP